MGLLKTWGAARRSLALQLLHWLYAQQWGGADVERERERERERELGEEGSALAGEIGNACELRLPIIAHQPERCYWESRAQAVRRTEPLSAGGSTREDRHTQGRGRERQGEAGRASASEPVWRSRAVGAGEQTDRGRNREKLPGQQ